MEEKQESIALPGTFHRAYVAIILNMTSMVIQVTSKMNACVSLDIAQRDCFKISIKR
jgi:hypothetical protein